MDDAAAAAARTRTLTCDDRTAPSMARALMVTRMARFTTAALLVLVLVLAGVPLAVAGYPVGGLVEGVAGAAVIAAVLAWSIYRRALSGMSRVCPPGFELTAVLGDDDLTLVSGVGESRRPWAGFRATRLVKGHLLLRVRDLPLYVVLPQGLLGPGDHEWVDRAVATAVPTSSAEHPPGPADPPRPPDAAVAPVAPGAAGVLITRRMVRRAERAVVRGLLAGRTSVTLALLALAVWLWTGSVTGRWVLGAAAGAVVAAALFGALATRLVYWLRRSSGEGRVVSVRLDDEAIHLQSGGSTSSTRYAAFRRLAVRDHMVLLWLRNGVIQVLPLELLDDDALARLRAAVGERRGRAARQSGT